MNGTRRVLVKCANPRCWRHFVTTIDARRICCDLMCDLQLAASRAQASRRVERAPTRKAAAS